MKSIFLALLAVTFVVGPACTRLQPTEAAPQELQRMILSDGILEPGQRVRLVTDDEIVYAFRITAIDNEQGLIIGNDESVEVARIVAVETREISAGRTGLLTGGLVMGIGVIIAIAIAPAAILGGF